MLYSIPIMIVGLVLCAFAFNFIEIPSQRPSKFDKSLQERFWDDRPIFRNLLGRSPIQSDTLRHASTRFAQPSHAYEHC